MKFVNVKNMIKKIAALVCAAFVFVGCEGLGSDAQIFAPQSSGAAASGGGTAYVTVGKVRASDGGVSRTVAPEAVGAESFSDFTLNMLDEANHSHVTLATAATLTELVSEVIEVPAGERRFSLTATRGGVTFGGTTTATLQDGDAISLSFTLSADSSAKGNIFVTVNFTGNAACAEYSLESYALPAPSVGDALFSKSAGGGTATVELSDVDPGNYTLAIKFYGDAAKTIRLNEYRELVRVSAGLTSRAERSIDLNELYTITYKYYLDDAEVTGETEIAEIIDSISGGTLPENFSRHSRITLPEVSHDGWEFKGWYSTATVDPNNKITTIGMGTAENQTLYAMFVTAGSGSGGTSGSVTTMYVMNTGLDANTGLTEDSPVDSIATAVRKIAALVDDSSSGHAADEDWMICLLSDIGSGQSIGSDLDGKAALVTIASKDASDVKAITGDENLFGLKIDTSVPIELKDLNIVDNTHSTGTENDAGLVVVSGSVTMQNGLISGNSSWGVYICAGASFTMNGGAVKDNYYEDALTHSMSYREIFNLGNFYMTDGTVGGTNSEIGVQIFYPGKVYLSGSAQFTPDAIIDSAESGSIIVDNPVMLSADEKMAVIDNSSLNVGDVVLATENGVNVADVVNYFVLLYPAYKIDDEGKLALATSGGGGGSSGTVDLTTPLTIEAAVSGATVTFKNMASGSVTYKKNGVEEETITSGDTATITLEAVGDKVCFYGNNTCYWTNSAQSNIFCDKDCYVYGNIMSLVSPSNFENSTQIQADRAFFNLFMGNANDAANIIYNKITNKEGADLFLPATVLTRYCYNGMFRFTNLTKAPALEAETLATGCYASMFEKCSMLQVAPELKAQTLESQCYQTMFSGCSSLSSVTCLATGISSGASNCTSDWLSGVAAPGTFTKAASMTGWTNDSASGIPSGWTVQDYGSSGGGGSGGGGTMTFYVAPDGSGDGTEGDPFGSIAEAVAQMTSDETDYIVNVCGDMSGGGEWNIGFTTDEESNEIVAAAKSITIQGYGGTNVGNKLPGVYAKSAAPITFKDIQIGALFIDAFGNDDDGFTHAYVTLDSGAVVKNNTSITEINGRSLHGTVDIQQYGCATLTMKSGAEISGNTVGGGVYIGQYSKFIMEGGTISGNTTYDVINDSDGTFTVSGDAQAGNVFCKSHYQPESQSVPIYIGGPLTSDNVAVITPGFYDGWQAIDIADGVNLEITDVNRKFGVYDPDEDDNEDTFWIIGDDGKLLLRDITD